jgi:hypothetical protein
MADKVIDGFRALDEMLKLDPQVHDQARRVRTAVEDAVKAAGLMETVLLQGSYGRKTMRPPLKDVDLVMVLPASLAHLRTKPGMSQWAFDGFRRAIEDAGVLPGVRFDVHEEAAHALQLTFPGVDFTVDLVPAFETEEAGQGWLYIADREQDQWTERSDVRRLRDRVAARNQGCGGVWVNQVRQAKHSLDDDGDVKRLVCGLLVESLAYEALTTRLTPQEALLRIFRSGAEKLTGAYVGLAQEDLTAKWSSSDRAQVVRFFQQNQGFAAEAMRLEGAGDAIAAMGVWREVFGDLFPVPEVSFAERLRTVSLVGGGITAGGRLTTAPGNVRPGRPWRAVDPELGDHKLATSFRRSSASVPTMDALLDTPAEVAALVAAGQVIWGAADVVGRELCGGAAAILELDLLPLPEAAAEGHPTERVRIVVTRGREVIVYPLGCPGRPWRHRNDFHPKMLCLQFPGDDPALLWLWPDGLEPLLARVRMHLMCEEVYRRDGVWPGEELPHGRPENDVVWPVSSDALRRAMRRWAR